MAGLDEAGRGPLAGPLVAAAVVFPPFPSLPWLQGLRDSKALTPARREALYPLITRAAAWALGLARPEEVDRLGPLGAARLAFLRALQGLPRTPQHLLIDAVPLPQAGLPFKAIVKGDALCASIAAASVIAKVARDRLMADLDQQYPGYGFARHKGYGTPAHLQALHLLGPCPLHRLSFRPLRDLSGANTPSPQWGEGVRGSGAQYKSSPSPSGRGGQGVRDRRPEHMRD